jgi:hypothetical protein
MTMVTVLIPGETNFQIGKRPVPWAFRPPRPCQCRLAGGLAPMRLDHSHRHLFFAEPSVLPVNAAAYTAVDYAGSTATRR